MDSKQLEEKAEKEWKLSKKIRAEFDSAESYAAYLKAKKAGRVKIFGEGEKTNEMV